MSRFIHFAIACCVGTLVAACGGGGGSTAAPVVTNGAPTANAGTARAALAGMSVALDGSASTDPEGSALSYSWSFSSKPASSNATLIGAGTAKPSFIADVAGNYVLSLTVNDGQLSSTASSVTVTALSLEALSIKTDKADLLSGSVQLSLSESTQGAPVTWHVDKSPIGAGSSLAWDTNQVSNTPHQLTARIQLAGDSTADVKRKVNVANSGIDVSTLRVARLEGDSWYNMLVSAQAAPGIDSVSLAIDGAMPVTVRSMNYCVSAPCTNGFDRYGFVVDSTRMSMGEHSLLITAIDRKGVQQQIEVPYVVSPAPTVTVNSPSDSQFVSGDLKVEGSYATDKPGGAKVTVWLSDEVSILKTTESSFKLNYSLKNNPAGPYFIRVHAVDIDGMLGAQGRVVYVTPTAELAYVPFAKFGSSARLLATDGNRMVFSNQAGQSVRLLDLTSGAERSLIQLDPSTPTVNWAEGEWALSDETVVGRFVGKDCETPDKTCMYMWRPGASVPVNLTAGNPTKGIVLDRFPVVRDGIVVWTSTRTDQTQQLVTYNIASGQYGAIAPPTGAVISQDLQHDVAVRQGVTAVFYSAATGGTASSQRDVFRWDSTTGTSTRLTLLAGQHSAPKVDGERVVWPFQALVPAASESPGFFSAAITSGTSSRLVSTSQQILNWRVRGGLLNWFEENSQGLGTIKALPAGGAVRTVATSASLPTSWYDSDGANIVYMSSGMLYGWDLATGSTKLRVVTVPSQVAVFNGTLFFNLGNNNDLYKVPLN